MRSVLKLTAGVILLFLLLNYLPKNYSNKILDLDNSLKSLFSCFGIQEENLIKSTQKQKRQGKITYYYIEKGYSISPDFPIQQFYKNVSRFLKKKGFEFKRQTNRRDEREIGFESFFKNLKVYKLSLNIKRKGYLALVIDDWGYSPSVIPYLKEITIPLNVSILPDLRYSETINKTAQDYRHETLLHLPMQPQNFKKMEKYLEKSTIKEAMSDRKAKEILTKFLSGLDNIKGANNHMGSLLTKNREKMTLIFKTLKKKNLYFLDSKVIPDSVVKDCAKKVHIVCFERDIFLDNELNSDYIKKQIRKAIAISQKKGYVIAIGHAKQITLETIKNMIPEIIENTYPSKLSDLK